MSNQEIETETTPAAEPWGFNILEILAGRKTFDLTLFTGNPDIPAPQEGEELVREIPEVIQHLMVFDIQQTAELNILIEQYNTKIGESQGRERSPTEIEEIKGLLAQVKASKAAFEGTRSLITELLKSFGICGCMVRNDMMAYNTPCGEIDGLDSSALSRLFGGRNGGIGIVISSGGRSPFDDLFGGGFVSSFGTGGLDLLFREAYPDYSGGNPGDNNG